MEHTQIGIMGGSGLYQLDGIEQVQEHTLHTPYGKPSDNIITGVLKGVPIAFLARHGRGHRLLPSEVPYRANIYAFKQLGVRYLLSFSAVGSLREHIAPLDFVLPNQYIDLTKQRVNTFFGEGSVAHVSMAAPVCENLTRLIQNAAHNMSEFSTTKLHTEATYVCIEGPQFSTRAESQWFRNMNADVVGMTNMPEAKLAREAQMAYASVAMVTDYDCWHPKEAAVTAESAIANLMRNAECAKKLLQVVLPLLAQNWPDSAAHTALNAGLVTQKQQMNASTLDRLNALLR